MSKSTIIIIVTIITVALAAAILFRFFIIMQENSSAAQILSASELNQFSSSAYGIFTDAQNHFSFQYPKEFLVTTQSTGDFGDTILVRGPQSKLEIQIALFSFDEDAALTRERILLDLPDMIIEKEQNVLIGEKRDIPALLFSSRDSDVGDTKEVWFVYAGFLYQVSTLAENEAELGAFLEKWHFNE